MTRPRRADGGANRCDYCRLPIPESPVTLERDDAVYHFCSSACREAMVDSDRVFTQYHGSRRFRTGVSAFDAGLPQGIPRNSFVLLSNQAGVRDEAVQVELVWRTLQRGEPAVVMTFLEPPISVVQEFATLDWNVLPYLETGQLHILDCFSHYGDRDREFGHMGEWNGHLARVAADATVEVEDPSNVRSIENRLDACLDACDMSETGIVVIDSLTEFGTLVQPVQAYGFIKDVRADVPKDRFVPIFAGATRTGDDESFPNDLDYMADGVVDLRLNPEIVEDTLIKQLRVRKASGVLTIPEWTAYEYTAGEGMVTFDPLEEIEKSREGEVTVEKRGEEGGDGGEDSEASADDAGE